jgi:DNA-binding NarL/FixJ family response regulator
LNNVNERTALKSSERPEAPRRPSGNLASVWLIEDNRSFRVSVQRVLDQLPDLHCPRAFSSCEEALAELRGHSRPDVILLDVGLPGMSGLEGIALLTAAAPRAHIIMLTVFDDSEKILKAICAGASGYLLKGAQPEKIAEAIHEVLNGGAPMNGRIARSVLKMFARMAAPAENYGLTPREEQVLKHLVSGLTKKEIAAESGLSYHTIDTHLRNIYTKLQVHTRGGAVAKALQARLCS